MVSLSFPTNLSVIEKVITLTKRTRVIVLLEGNLRKQWNSSFSLTCDQAFSFSGKVFFLSPPKQKGRRIAWSQVTFCPDHFAPRGRLERLQLVGKSREALCAKVANAMKESEDSPVRLISLPYLTLSVNVFCTEVQWNLDITNLYITKSSVWRTIFFTPVTAK